MGRVIRLVTPILIGFLLLGLYCIAQDVAGYQSSIPGNQLPIISSSDERIVSPEDDSGLVPTSEGGEFSSLGNNYPASENLAITALSRGDRVQTIAKWNVRPVPGTGNSPIKAMAKGCKGTIIDGPQVKDGLTWWKVKYDDGTTGWSSQNGLESASTTLSDTSIVFTNNDRVQTIAKWNVRPVPGTGNSPIKAMAKGCKGTIIDGPQVKDGLTWWKVKYDDGTTGWSSQNGLERCEVCYTVKVISDKSNTPMPDTEIYIGDKDKYCGKTDSNGLLNLPQKPLGGTLGNFGLFDLKLKAKHKCPDGRYASGYKEAHLSSCTGKPASPTEMKIKIGECGETLTN